jgi:hypothetical protein
MLIEQSCGPLYGVSTDHDVLARELAAATATINGEVVVEASTMAVITLLPERADAPVGIHRSQAPASLACGHRTCLE